MPYVYGKLFWLLPSLVHLLARCSEVRCVKVCMIWSSLSFGVGPTEHQCIQSVLPYVTAETKLLMIAIHDCREVTDGINVCHRVEKCRQA